MGVQNVVSRLSNISMLGVKLDIQPWHLAKQHTEGHKNPTITIANKFDVIGGYEGEQDPHIKDEAALSNVYALNVFRVVPHLKW